MLIDCDSCTERPRACGECVVSVLLGMPGERVPGERVPGERVPGPGPELDADERGALEVLAGAGMVPPLRLQRRGEAGGRRVAG
jgi:hypothetical protein